MGYGLGVDLGTSSTVAATARGERVDVIQLGGDSYSVPSVVAIGADGSLLAGEAAVRRAASHPTSAAREYKRRFGDPAPIVMAGQAYPADKFAAAQLADVLARVARIEGAAPDRLVLTHPAAWGPFRLEALRAVGVGTGCPEVELVAEPVAAAVANRDRVAEGSLVAVYDLGGGTFDAAVVRCAGDVGEWAVVGVPEGVERLGGSDIDQLVLGHVDSVVGGQVFTLDSSLDENRAALLRLREVCRAAKEQLSEDTDVDVAVELPGLRTAVRLTRGELEGMLRPRLADSLAVLDRVVASAGATWDQIDAVLLVGGSSRIPAVGQMVQEHCGRPVVSGTNPQLAVALGAARLSAGTPASPGAVAAPLAAAAPAAAATGSKPAASATRAKAASPDAPKKKGVLVGAALAVVAVLGVGAFVLFGGGDESGDATSTTATSASSDSTGGADSASTLPADSTEPSATTAPDGVSNALGVSAVVCADEFTDGVVTSAQASVSNLLVVTDGAVLVAPITVDGSTCQLSAPDALSEGSGIIAAAAADSGFIAVSAAGGGSIIGTDGSQAACAPLVGPFALSGDGTALAWTPDGSTRRITVSADGCEVPTTDSAAPDLAVTAAAFVGPDRFLAGGTLASGGALGVVSYDRRTLEWSQTKFADGNGYQAVSAVDRCDDRICVVDAVGGRLHLLDDSGNHLGSVPLSELTGSDDTRFMAMSSDANRVLTIVAEVDGSLVVLRVDAGTDA